MAGLKDPPPARKFRVGDGPPGGAVKRQRQPTVQPAQARAGRDLPPFAKGVGVDGNAVAMLARELQPISIESLGQPDPLGEMGPLGQVAQFPGCAVPLNAAAYGCSQQVFDFLASNVLRNTDIVPIIRSGWVLFERSIGVHKIPLAVLDSDSNGNKFPGDIRVPDTQALIVTSFTPFAALTMPGLPGAWVSVDPQSLIGQVAFYLVADNGVHPLAETTLTQGETASGTEIVNAPEVSGNAHPPYTDVMKSSVGAAYKVFHSPFPGFPSIVGVKMRGYMINQQLLAEALDNKSYRAGG